MDLKSNFKKVLGVWLLGAAAITNSTAYAAEASVQVDVNLPTVLVMYHYNTITLNLDETALGGYLVGGTAAACLTGGDFCDDQGNPAPIDVTTIGATTTVNQAVVDNPVAATDTDITLVDVVGVRALVGHVVRGSDARWRARPAGSARGRVLLARAGPGHVLPVARNRPADVRVPR